MTNSEHYKRDYVGKMIMYDVQLHANDAGLEFSQAPLRSTSFHIVVRFRRDDVRDLLVDHGCSLRLADQITLLLPDGFPVVVDDADGMPVTSVLLHILAQHKSPKRNMKGPRSLNSAFAAAYDLCHFLDHMDEMAVTFDQTLDQDLVDGFAEAQSCAPSAWTGRLLTQGTIARRVASVAAFSRSKAFKAIGSADFSARKVPAFGEDRESGIHPMTPDDWTLLKGALGPKPTDSREGSAPSVIRLVVEWAIWTAGRRTEVTTIPLKNIELHADLLLNTSDNTARRIRVTNTKGRRPRDLVVPAGLLRETLAYVRNERARALAAAGLEEHGRLFVQPVGWRRPGQPLCPTAVSRRFAAAVARTSLKRRSWGSAGHGRSDRKYVFHDLRHTAAVWLYIAFANAGMPEPWKLVQVRLGHLHVETTTRTYLAFIDEFEAAVADLLSVEYDRWAEA